LCSFTSYNTDAVFCGSPNGNGEQVKEFWVLNRQYVLPKRLPVLI